MQLVTMSAKKEELERLYVLFLGDFTCIWDMGTSFPSFGREGVHGSHALFQVFFICTDASVGLGHRLASAVVTNLRMIT